MNESRRGFLGTTQTAILLVGDFLAIGLFVALGELQHGRPILTGGPTFVEFGVGWLIAGTVLGVFETASTADRGQAIVRTSSGWVLAVGIAQLFRAIRESGFSISPSFLAVSMAFGGALLLTWRLAVVEWVDYV